METILSVEARGDINWEEIKQIQNNLENFSSKPFDTEGIKVNSYLDDINTRFLIEELRRYEC